MGRAPSIRGQPPDGIESGQWARGTMQPPPMPSMPGSMLHKADASYKVRPVWMPLENFVDSLRVIAEPLSFRYVPISAL